MPLGRYLKNFTLKGIKMKTKIFTVEKAVIKHYCVEAESEEEALFKKRRGRPYETTKSLRIVGREE